jgi:hypothetical protein
MKNTLIMKKKISLIAIAILSMVFIKCNKVKQSPAEVTKANLKSSGARQLIPQKSYDVSSEVTNAAIKRFKASVKSHQQTTNNSQARLLATDVSLDSSLWVLEAALNYDFDEFIDNTNYQRLRYDSVEYTYVAILDDEDMIVESDDVEAAYNDISSYITNNVLNTTNVKVEAVDIEAYIDPGVGAVVFKAIIAPVLTSVTNPCSSFPSNASYDRPNLLPFCGGSTPSGDGPGLVQARLNCISSLNCGVSDGYYSNITSPSFGPYLYYNGAQGTICNSGNAILTSTQLTSIYNTLDGVATSNLPTGKNIIAKHVYASQYYPLCVCNFTQQWDYKVFYGKFNCVSRTN